MRPQASSVVTRVHSSGARSLISSPKGPVFRRTPKKGAGDLSQNDYGFSSSSSSAGSTCPHGPTRSQRLVGTSEYSDFAHTAASVSFFFYRLCAPEGVAEANLQPRCPWSIAGLSAAFTGSWIILVPPIFFFYPTPQTLSSALLIPGKRSGNRAEEGLLSGDLSLPFCGHPSPDTPCISLLWRKHVSILR